MDDWISSIWASPVPAGSGIIYREGSQGRREPAIRSIEAQRRPHPLCTVRQARSAASAGCNPHRISFPLGFAPGAHRITSIGWAPPASMDPRHSTSATIGAIVTLRRRSARAGEEAARRRAAE